MDDFKAEFEKLVQLDQEWRDHFSQTNAPIRHSAEDEEKAAVHVRFHRGGHLLQEMLLEQVRESNLTEEQRPIAELLIGNIDDYGYLKATSRNFPRRTTAGGENGRSLKVIQTFDPPGVGARDLRECLMLQLERTGSRRPSNIASCAITWRRSANGASRKLPAAPGLRRGRRAGGVERIARLEPRPGRAFLLGQRSIRLAGGLCAEGRR